MDDDARVKIYSGRRSGHLYFGGAGADVSVHADLPGAPGLSVMVAQDVLGKAAEQDAIERGMRAAQQLGDLAANSTTAVSDQRMNLRAEIEAQLKPPDPPPGGDAIGGNLLAMQTTPMQGLTLALDSKMGALVNDIEMLINPPPRKRTVYGAAQAIEKGSLRPPPTPPPRGVQCPRARVPRQSRDGPRQIAGSNREPRVRSAPHAERVVPLQGRAAHGAKRRVGPPIAAAPAQVAESRGLFDYP